MGVLYPEEIRRVLSACQKYRDKEINIEELKAAIWGGAQGIVAHEERDLRKMLQWAEGQLDSIQFTKEDVYPEALQIVAAVEQNLKNL